MLKNKTILITGSSSGIGAATARLAKKYGAVVILHGKEKSEPLVSLAAELQSDFVVCDVSNEEEVTKNMADLLKKYPNINTLINAAGISISKPFLELSIQDWQEIFSVNVLGTVNMSKALLPLMKNNSGAIINISSLRGFETTSGRAAYSSSKAAIKNLTAVLAKEFAPNIRVNAVAPGFTNTNMCKTWEERTWTQANSSLFGRIAEPEEIAETILFLASDRASFITGQTILVDGGYSLSGK